MFRATLCPSSGADDLEVFIRCVAEPWLCRQSDPVGCLSVHWEAPNCKYELNCEYCNIRNKAPWWWSDKIEISRIVLKCFVWNYMCIRWLINWNVQLTSQLLTCILSYTVDVCAFSRYYSIFFFSRTPKLGSYPWRYAYPGLGVTGIAGELSGGKAASVWCWPLTPSSVEDNLPHKFVVCTGTSVHSSFVATEETILIGLVSCPIRAWIRLSCLGVREWWWLCGVTFTDLHWPSLLIISS